MPLSIKKENENLVLKYSPQNGINWILEKFNRNENVTIKKVFCFNQSNLHLCSEHNESIEFVLGKMSTINGNNFFQLDKSVLDISFTLYIEESCNITENWFVGERSISIFKIINTFWTNDFYISKNTDFLVSEKDFKRIILSLPNRNELYKYTNARICATFKNFLPTKKDAETSFQKYLNKKQLPLENFDKLDFHEFEIFRYEQKANKLEEMLANLSAYKETDWQKCIMKFIHVLFPKYVVIERHPKIIIKEKAKIPDIIMADVNGYVDIIEIKKPFPDGMISAKKSNLYRNNFIPLRELSGAVMQCEKYIYYMTKESEKTTSKLNEQFKTLLPNDYSLKIANPKAMIIMGRSYDFSNEQTDDFEIIKRKYKNILDIITYDDLLFRLKQTVKLLTYQTYKHNNRS